MQNGITQTTVRKEKTLDTNTYLCYATQGARIRTIFARCFQGTSSALPEAEMEAKLKQAYLYDFYGELLNDHQRKVYEDFYFNDLSLSEIAEEEGISRQGVHDLAKRSARTLEEYEKKLHLIEKFLNIKDKVEQIQRLVQKENPETAKAEIARISDEILECM